VLEAGNEQWDDNLTEPVAVQAGAMHASLSNRRDWKYFDEKLAELRVSDVENIRARAASDRGP
jgi:hypothetical protein